MSLKSSFWTDYQVDGNWGRYNGCKSKETDMSKLTILFAVLLVYTVHASADALFIYSDDRKQVYKYENGRFFKKDVRALDKDFEAVKVKEVKVEGGITSYVVGRNDKISVTGS